MPEPGQTLLKPNLAASFDDVPLKVPLLDTAVYDFVVNDANIKADSNVENPGVNLNVRCQVTTDGPFKGKTQFHTISTTKPTPQEADVRLNRFFKACGVPPVNGQFDITQLKGKSFRGAVERRTYVDKSGVTRESADIREVWIPGEPELVVKVQA